MRRDLTTQRRCWWLVVLCVVVPVSMAHAESHPPPASVPDSPGQSQGQASASGSVEETPLGKARGMHLGDFSPLPQEPDEFDDRELGAHYDWRNSLFFREFDMTGDGVVNFMTARRTYNVWLDDFGTPVVMTVGAPLFYWLDLNGNGEFETGNGEMWSDPAEDGITGNERLYDTSHLEEQPSRVPRWSAPDP
ncbi:MAG: hypothetical protein OXR07_06415 [Nitrospira sp.]|nr:hypothetical protein [Nitrospira sp.]